MFGTKIAVKLVQEDVYKYTDAFIKFIQVIRTYRDRIKDIKEIANISKTGIYVLIGVNDSGQTIVYVGKATNVYERVCQHSKDENKDFFSEFYIITSTDNSFGDSEASYLENLLYNRLRITPSIIVFNDVVPPKGNLSEDLEENCEVYGEVIVSIISQSSNGRLLVTQHGKKESSKFFLKGIKKCEIQLTYFQGKYIVHKDSKISKILCSDPTQYMKSERDRFVENGDFIEYKDFYILANDIMFDNIGRATNILTGSKVSNVTSLWKNYNNVTLKDYLDSEHNN